jgi:Domain of unknown function (DUF397)
VSEQDQADLAWRKSSESESGQSCVEVAIDAGAVYLRHSQHRSGPVLEFLHKEWAAFLTGVHNGEFELPSQPIPQESD